jgi:SNF2 family DNA or RNA helicase
MNSKLNMILEPLSQATAEALDPPQLKESDHLFLWLDPTDTKFVAEVVSLDADGKEQTWPGVSFAAHEFFNRMPERQWLGSRDHTKHNRFVVAGTDINALLIHHCWPKDRIHFGFGPGREQSEGARLLYNVLLGRFFTQTRRAEMVAEFKLSGTLPPQPEDWIEHTNEKLRLEKYQRAAVMMGLGHDQVGLFMDRGTGKTASSIQLMCMEAARKMASGKGMFRSIIVCPPQVCLNWKLEIERFAVVPGKVTVVRGSPETRVKQLIHAIRSEDDCAFSAIIIGYESLVRSIDDFSRVDWDQCITDESHFFKSAQTKRWKDGVKPIRDRAAQRVALTGTPIGNTPFDLWTQLEFLAEGMSGFQNFKKFRKFFGSWENVDGAPGVERLVALKNMPLLQERLARCTFQITKKDAGLNLPDKQYDVHEVFMTKEQTEAYNKISQELALEFEDKLTGQVDSMTVEHILVQLLRLSQITSGHLVWNEVRDPDTGDVLRERRVEQINEKNPKVDAIQELLTADDRDPNGKTIIWCHWKPDVAAVSKRLTELGINHGTYNGDTPQKDRQGLVDEFNGNPDFKVLICNPQTAAEGLNLLGYDHWEDEPKLATNCDHQIIMSQGWSAILRGQLEDRAHRRGTRVPVRVTDLVIANTIDEEIRTRVEGKQKMASMTLDIKDILRNVLGF